MTTTSVYIDGQFVSEFEAGVSVFDHGLLYGDGVFEDLRAYGGRLFRLHEHLDCLYQSAAVLSLAVPLSKDALADVVVEACRVNQLSDAYVRVIVTRGIGDLNPDPQAGGAPTVIVVARPSAELRHAEQSRRGARLVTIPSRIIPELHHLNVRSLNHLAKTLGKIKAHQKGGDECLFLDTRSAFTRGYVSDTTAGSLFLIRQGALVTPTVNNCLDGIARQTVMEVAAQEGLRVTEEPLLLSDVYSAEEVFVTDTAVEVVPVVAVDNFPVGEGKPGPITRQLAGAYRRYVHLHGEFIDSNQALAA